MVIGGEAGDGDPSAVATAWTGSSTLRPGAVVLVETLRAVDRFRAIAAGVDAVFPADQVEQKLPRYARTFARIGPPPSNVLLVDHDQTDAPPGSPRRWSRPTSGWRRCRAGPRCQEVLERELPDLLLLKAHSPDSDGFALARLVRQDPRYHLLADRLARGKDSDRIARSRQAPTTFVPCCRRSGASGPAVVSPAAGAVALRELVHRDGLTGLLNHVTLMAELEHAVEYSRRHGEPLALSSSSWRGSAAQRALGPRASEEVLLHVAAVFRANVRASDVIGRYGWEAFGMLLRGASASGAAVLAEKLHRVLARPTGPDHRERADPHSR